MDLDDILYQIDKTKKNIYLWWRHLPYQNKLLAKVVIGGGGFLATAYGYLYWRLAEVAPLAAVMGVVFLLIFLGGARDVVS